MSKNSMKTFTLQRASLPISPKRKRQLSTWGIPAIYAGVAIAAALTFPRLEGRIFHGFVSPVSISAATAIYSAIASGMIALTGIVFSLQAGCRLRQGQVSATPFGVLSQGNSPERR
jgi:uncharacterized membrane protein